ncbi:MAG: hypothetical protein AAF585_03975 [Verrucomicrobiota bacterium]
MREYKYIGNPDFIPKGEFPPRMQLNGEESLASWMNEHRDEMDLEACVPATFVVDADGLFWIADRGSEHVACARLGAVRSAGEVFFGGLDSDPHIHRITNQSTGYCPEPGSWVAVDQALETAKIAYPSGFEPAFEFRRCDQCAALAIVKDAEFFCLLCGAELSAHWNLGS